MADVQVRRLDELPSYENQGGFIFVGKGLGISSFGINVLRMPPNWADYPEHDETSTGQEEVYVVTAGSATLTAGGSSWPLTPGSIARVGPAETRKIVPGPEGATIVALGGIPGKPYVLPDWIK
ncbi:MAG TPA: hypothetical protein VF139_01825 [Candidatus Polarisedimenticolaceae bacterium]